jgi:hypothetical protein
MTYQWLRGPVFVCGGLVILGICRRAERLDPFSRTFVGSASLDELERTLKEEEEKRHRPLV